MARSMVSGVEQVGEERRGEEPLRPSEASAMCCGQTLASVQPFAIDEFITDGFPIVVCVHLII